MKVDFIAFADFAATDSAGKMTIVGLFDRINTLAPQVQLPIIAIPIRFRAEAADPTGRPLKIQLRAKGLTTPCCCSLMQKLLSRGCRLEFR